MKKRNLYIAWGVFYLFCTVLGFIPAKEGGFFALCMGLGLGFFVPPMLLMCRGEKKTVQLVTTLSGVSLAATALMLVLNVLTVGASAAVGEMFYWLLILVSSPMICIQVRGISLFLWACLLFAGLGKLKKT